ncbi:MAG: M48 family metallopeptidase [Desulfobulbaceae bacterium]
MHDFFERQSEARRNSLLLLLYFLIALAAVVVLVSAALYVMFSFNPVRLNHDAVTPFNLSWRTWDFTIFGKIAGAVLLLILCGTLYKYLRLRSGGGAMIAEMLGGRLIYPDTDDFHERRLLNIIEEMAIASGVTVPSVYLLAEEKGINAFAAGFSEEDAVLGVTWGTLRYLTREELQGVIAHEFSHILSGDMLINIRLQGLLHGILVIGLLGQTLLRGAVHSGSRQRGGAGAAGIGIGLILFSLGYAGVFVGKLLKSAIARQREFLADAAAVQFTRNPLGLAGALKKIGGLDEGSRIRNPSAAEISHMYFGNGLAESWLSAFSTHPPLGERIRRLDPGFRGDFARRVEPVVIDREEALVYASLAGGQATAARAAEPMPQGGPDASVAGEDLRRAMTEPGPARMDLARELLEGLPRQVRLATRNAFGARAVVYGLLLDKSPDVRNRQLAVLKKNIEPQLWQEFSLLLPDLVDLPPELRLPLADLTVPTLKTLSPAQYQSFRAMIRTLMESDGRLDLFEYALHHVLLKHLQAHFAPTSPRLAPSPGISAIREDLSCVLSLLARYGNNDEGAARRAMMLAVRSFTERERKYLTYQDESLCTAEHFDRALQRLNAAGPAVKEQLLAAALECIIWDNRITVREAELYRIVTEALERPVPPWLTIKPDDRSRPGPPRTPAASLH